MIQGLLICLLLFFVLILYLKWICFADSSDDTLSLEQVEILLIFLHTRYGMEENTEFVSKSYWNSRWKWLCKHFSDLLMTQSVFNNQSSKRYPFTNIVVIIFKILFLGTKCWISWKNNCIALIRITTITVSQNMVELVLWMSFVKKLFSFIYESGVVKFVRV